MTGNNRYSIVAIDNIVAFHGIIEHGTITFKAYDWFGVFDQEIFEFVAFAPNEASAGYIMEALLQRSRV